MHTYVLLSCVLLTLMYSISIKSISNTLLIFRLLSSKNLREKSLGPDLALAGLQVTLEESSADFFSCCKLFPLLYCHFLVQERTELVHGQ